MANCKECIHFVVCDEVPTKSADDCDFFKDRSRFVELPANGIMYGIIDGRVTELLNLIVQPGDIEMCVLSPDNINKTIFSTKEQAEQALKERENDTPEAAIIRLNQFRTDKDERDPAINMAIRAINRVFVKRKPEPEPRYYGNGRCPSCHVVFMDKSTKYCGNCGQALDWRNT